MADFLKAQGCDATEDDLKVFFEEKAKGDKPLSEDELENVAGGRSMEDTYLSTFSYMIETSNTCDYDWI